MFIESLNSCVATKARNVYTVALVDRFSWDYVDFHINTRTLYTVSIILAASDVLQALGNTTKLRPVLLSPSKIKSLQLTFSTPLLPWVRRLFLHQNWIRFLLAAIHFFSAPVFLLAPSVWHQTKNTTGVLITHFTFVVCKTIKQRRPKWLCESENDLNGSTIIRFNV